MRTIPNDPLSFSNCRFYESLQKHKSDSNQERSNKIIECNNCHRRFYKKSSLVRHIKQHHKSDNFSSTIGKSINQRGFECSLCEYKSNSKGTLKNCHRRFCKKSSLVRHIQQHHKSNNFSSTIDESINQRVFECSLCEYKSNNRGTLKNHFIRLHTNGYEHSCETCGKQFKIKKALNYHIKQHHGVVSAIVCDVCGRCSKNIHALKAHMKYQHYKPDFICNICKRGMTTKKNLEQHLDWHENKEKVPCPTCEKRFRKRDMDTHMRVHTGVKPFTCPVCGKNFRRKTALEQHVIIHTGKKPYVCDICRQTFAQKPGLITHRKKHPGPLPPLPTVSIKKIVTEFTRELETRSLKITTTKSTTSPAAVTCVGKIIIPNMKDASVSKIMTNINDKSKLKKIHVKFNPNFKDSKTQSILLFSLKPSVKKVVLQRYLQSSIKKEEQIKSFKKVQNKSSCVSSKLTTIVETKSEPSISLPTSLKKESLMVSDNNTETIRNCSRKAILNKEQYNCSSCKESFAFERDLRYHFQVKHNSLLHSCDYCEFKSKSKYTVKEHTICKHSYKSEHVCSICSKAFKLKSLLKQHIKLMHTIGPPVICTDCGHKAKNITAHKQHVKYKHCKPEFECSLCKRGLTTKENLESHMNWHKNRKVVCQFCGKMFKEKRALDIHMRIHEGVKPYSCPVCNKSFTKKSAQEQHVLIHTGLRPYTCDICNQSFTQKPGLISHRKIHPGTLPPLPTVRIKNIITDFMKQFQKVPSNNMGSDEDDDDEIENN